MQNTIVREYKKVKDPVYGYIPIEIEYVRNIIDTPMFQRLRRVMQTSYSPLYSSSLHNRFVHSLGVFHLGCIVAKCLEESILNEDYIFADAIEEKEEIAKKLSHVFRLACLLHDVGHAPFSHTGEIYYIYYKNDNEEEVSVRRLHEKLCRLLNSESFKADLPAESDSAAPHELMSAIENVVYAHDAEKKWIQNHPVVLYEAYIIKHILEHLGDELNTSEETLFSEASLNVEGHVLNGNIKMSLMCDDDIIYLSKNVFSDELSQELFDRNRRRHPVWKSEAEYEAYVRSIGTDEEKDLFKACMDSFNASNIPAHPVPLIINESLLKKLETELVESKKQNKPIRALTRKVNACKYMDQYSREHGMPFDYLIIPTSMFSSSFSKENLRKVLVNFDGKRPKMLKEVCRLLSAERLEDTKDFYYLFYRRGEQTTEFSGRINDVGEFCKGLIDTCLKDDIT